MIICVNGAIGDKYTFEIVEHIELIGTTLPNETASHTDPQNFSIVDSTIKEAFNHGPPQPTEERGIIARIGDAIGNALPKIQSFLSGGMTSVPGIVKGLMALVPTTGGSPMIANQGFSYPMLMARQSRIDAGYARLSNMAKTADETLLRELTVWFQANPQAGSPTDFMTSLLELLLASSKGGGEVVVADNGDDDPDRIGDNGTPSVKRGNDSVIPFHLKWPLVSSRAHLLSPNIRQLPNETLDQMEAGLQAQENYAPWNEKRRSVPTPLPSRFSDQPTHHDT